LLNRIPGVEGSTVEQEARQRLAKKRNLMRLANGHQALAHLLAFPKPIEPAHRTAAQPIYLGLSLKGQIRQAALNIIEKQLQHLRMVFPCREIQSIESLDVSSMREQFLHSSSCVLVRSILHQSETIRPIGIPAVAQAGISSTGQQQSHQCRTVVANSPIQCSLAL
jgi:hypothetical protein